MSRVTINTSAVSDPATRQALDDMVAAINDLSQRFYWGAGDPNTQVTADVGAVFLRLNGGIGSTMYVKEVGSGNTGWAAK